MNISTFIAIFALIALIVLWGICNLRCMQPLTPSTVRREPKLKPKPKRQITGIYDDELLEDYPTAGSWNY